MKAEGMKRQKRVTWEKEKTSQQAFLHTVLSVPSRSLIPNGTLIFTELSPCPNETMCCRKGKPVVRSTVIGSETQA